MNLEEIRTEIDALDKQLLALFERRMDLCRDVALYKKEHNLPVFQPEREEKLLEKIEQAAAPKAAVTCPYCGATTTPDASGCCEYCGGAVNG